MLIRNTLRNDTGPIISRHRNDAHHRKFVKCQTKQAHLDACVDQFWEQQVNIFVFELFELLIHRTNSLEWTGNKVNGEHDGEK
jgi:hypothetical protein